MKAANRCALVAVEIMQLKKKTIEEIESGAVAPTKWKKGTYCSMPSTFKIAAGPPVSAANSAANNVTISPMCFHHASNALSQSLQLSTSADLAAVGAAGRVRASNA
jgi:hypothetical protein